MYWGSVSIIQSDSYLGLSQNKQLSLIQWLSQIIILTIIGPGEYFLSNHTQQCISYRYTFTIFHCLYRYFFIHIHMWIGMWSTVYIQQIHTIVQSYSLLWVLKSSRGNLCIHVHVFISMSSSRVIIFKNFPWKQRETTPLHIYMQELYM